jgi:hypothetical protein
LEIVRTQTFPDQREHLRRALDPSGNVLKCVADDVHHGKFSRHRAPNGRNLLVQVFLDLIHRRFHESVVKIVRIKRLAVECQIEHPFRAPSPERGFRASIIQEIVPEGYS